MSRNHQELRNQIVESLKRLSHETEIVYLGMAEAYPALIQEMKNSLRVSESILRSNQQIAMSSHSPLLETIEETREYVLQANRGFSETHIRDQAMHQGLGEQVQSVSDLNEYIYRIHEDSSAMELISLNAMTVAIKAGNHGRAFSFITEELKRLSGQTIDLTRFVTSRGEALVKFFKEFQTELNRLSTLEHSIFGDFMQRMDSIFGDFTEGVKGITHELYQLIKKSEEVQTPLFAIMTEIQNHDLIRQSIDHVIMSLAEIRTIEKSDNAEQTLDELSFLEILPDLCTHVLTEIEEQIDRNRLVFQANIEKAQKLVEALDSERSRFINISLDQNHPDSIELKFANSRAMFENLCSEIESLYRAKEYTVNHSKELQRQVNSLNDSFKSFESLITRFRTIDIASRIEIAKQTVLQQMSGTVDEMTALTAKIDDDVSQSTTITGSFLEGTQRILAEYRHSFSQQSRVSRKFISQLQQRTNKLTAAKDALIQSIADCEIFTGTFKEQFASTALDLDKLSRLLTLIQDQKADLAAIKQQLIAERSEFMAAHGVKEWKLENSKLRSMIDRFTILMHKKYAGDLGGFQVEQGVQSGEITLF